jgi:hypothetical protein
VLVLFKSYVKKIVVARELCIEAGETNPVRFYQQGFMIFDVHMLIFSTSDHKRLGMSELLAIVYVVLKADRIDLNTSPTQDTFAELLDERFLEHDCYVLFRKPLLH